MPEVQGATCVLLDIEGTVCPIEFVKETLFPYALSALPTVLATQWDTPAFRPYRDAFPPETATSPAALQAHAEDLTNRDVKIAYLKNLQGYLWETGYKSGAYATPLFADVAGRLRVWNDAGVRLAIYSSGSVFAQKLLFEHVRSEQGAAGRKRALGEEQAADGVGAEPPAKKHAGERRDSEGDERPEEGVVSQAEAEADGRTEQSGVNTEDLRPLISGWYDTTNAGKKTEKASYEKIADALHLPPSEIVFLTDNVHEVDAAAAAGMRPFMVEREGNAPLSDADRKRLTVLESLDDVVLARPSSA